MIPPREAARWRVAKFGGEHLRALLAGELPIGLLEFAHAVEHLREQVMMLFGVLTHVHDGEVETAASENGLRECYRTVGHEVTAVGTK